MKSSAPARQASGWASLTLSLTRAVSGSTAASAVSGAARSRRQTSVPGRLGSRRSTTIRSGRASRAVGRAWAPSATARTRHPACSSGRTSRFW
ncbi:hypothetical protein PS9374_05158 [Planomonospora sphaerica]|uniref:Uncharacterized protein n=1 Tax=Planomonospora sphaerica TaxID=161355 RepID=A0A161MD97_9ACTN|nr:hypothetical protein [Planomonospora sphaerica]GAT69483.1 hypothetical protein PS9374_05158 [Planomonospora sphaerica]